MKPAARLPVLHAPLRRAVAGLILAAAGLSLAGQAFARGIPPQSRDVEFVDPEGDGSAVLKLSGTFYRPDTPGPWPLAVFNHGDIKDPSSRKTVKSAVVAQFLVEQGYAVYIPMRRGLGQSGGDFAKKGTQGCAGAFEGREVRDLEATLAAIRQSWHDIAPGPVLMTGQSAGGVLSLSYAGRHPEEVKAVLNFSGGWTVKGCETTRIFAELGRRARAVPTLWLYASNDSHYTPSLVSRNAQAYAEAGGRIQLLQTGEVQGKDGHYLYNVKAMWAPWALRFLSQPSPANNLVLMTPDEAQAAAKAAQPASAAASAASSGSQED